MSKQSGISVIIPVGKGDREWKNLFPDFKALDIDDEVIIASPVCLLEEVEQIASELDLACSCRTIVSAPGRARQLNAGASLADRSSFLFLHCDTRISANSIRQLKIKLKSNSEALWFFDLAFLDDGPCLMQLNQRGAHFRSHVLRLPFGDQGLSLQKDVFHALGKFSEAATYGEDHLLVWKAHQMGVDVLPVGAEIKTSSRKYRDKGWLRTTANHLSLTSIQAFPESIRFVKMRALRWIT